MRFLRHDRIYRSDGAVFRSGRNTASRWSGPGRAIRRDGRGTPFPSLSMSSDRLFLDRVGRHHCPSPLHRHCQHKILVLAGATDYHRKANCVLTVCLTPGGKRIVTLHHTDIADIGQCCLNMTEPTIKRRRVLIFEFLDDPGKVRTIRTKSARLAWRTCQTE